VRVSGVRLGTPTSNESMPWFIRATDLLSALLAAPIAMGLRDPTLFYGPRAATTLGYCLIGFSATLLMVFVFPSGRSIRNHVSSRDVRSVVMASLAATALTAVCAFSFDRLAEIPRSLPVIQFLVLCALMLGGRVAATGRSGSRGPLLKSYLVESHTILVGANEVALSYLKMLEAFNVDQSNIVAILDRDPKFFGRALCGHPIIGPPSAIVQVVKEYRVHGVEVDRILICENRPSEQDDKARSEIEELCRLANVQLTYLSDVLGFRLEETIKSEVEEELEVQARAKGFLFIKRGCDLVISAFVAIAFLPVLFLIMLGIMIDLGWPMIFWQRRIGYHGKPFLIFKFRTLHAPYDRQGNFVEEDRRTSRFGTFLRRTRLDELPQLWNIVCGDMSFVGPRPLLPVDQPDGSHCRLRMKPGITGWAQIHGGRNIAAPEKGLLDEWYVSHASIRLDLYIIARTIGAVLFGDSRKGSYSLAAPKIGKYDGGIGLLGTLAGWMRREYKPEDVAEPDLLVVRGSASSVSFAETEDSPA
jgi:lipopolysaccharide/colanic/teichoic acid biosynthesis glycosyltransferase